MTEKNSILEITDIERIASLNGFTYLTMATNSENLTVIFAFHKAEPFKRVMFAKESPLSNKFYLVSRFNKLQENYLAGAFQDANRLLSLDLPVSIRIDKLLEIGYSLSLVMYLHEYILPQRKGI